MVPAVTFKARVRDDKLGGDNPFDWKDVTTADLFKGKRVVLFALRRASEAQCLGMSRGSTTGPISKVQKSTVVKTNCFKNCTRVLNDCCRPSALIEQCQKAYLMWWLGDAASALL